MARPHTWQFLREKRNRGIRKRSYSVLRSPLAEVVINNSGGRAVSTKWACCDPDARRPSPVPLTVVSERGQVRGLPDVRTASPVRQGLCPGEF